MSRHTTNFGGYRYCGQADIIILVCHVSKDHVIKESCEFIGRSPSR